MTLIQPVILFENLRMFELCVDSALMTHRLNPTVIRALETPKQDIFDEHVAITIHSNFLKSLGGGHGEGGSTLV